MADDRSIRDVRLEKLQRMREMGCDPFKQERFERTRSARQMLDRFEGLQGETASYAGRIVSYRLMGKAGFAHVSDGDAKIQVYFRKDDLSESEWALYDLLDIGDHVGVTGELFLTKTGEKSIHARSLVVLSKCLEPLPLGKTREVKDETGKVTGTETWYELEDTEQRYRHRHLDLLANPEARKMLLDRCRITAAVRHYFDSQGFLEVETPMLQVEAGGAPGAKPFTTFYNAYEMEVKLRISLELYLKRIICGDVPKVYEIGRVFRNEGVSNRHSPEFTMVEFYEAYANLEDMMTHMENCFRHVVKEVFGTSAFTMNAYNVQIGGFLVAEGKTTGEVAAEIIKSNPIGIAVDFSAQWARIDLIDSICAILDLDPDDFKAQLNDLDGLKALVKRGLDNLPDRIAAPNRKVSYEGTRYAKITMDENSYWIDTIVGTSLIQLAKENNVGGLIEKLLETLLEPYLLHPTFVVGYPIETSPLAKKDPKRPGFTRRFEGYVLGREICNAFSEINDPIDQRERFEDQLKQASKGNDTAHGMDEDFIYALECGMPPTGGCGFGIDRMAMLLTGADHIREILLFPTMKPLA